MLPDSSHVKNNLLKLENPIQCYQRILIKTVMWHEHSIKTVFTSITDFNPNSAQLMSADTLYNKVINTITEFNPSNASCYQKFIPNINWCYQRYHLKTRY